jgi:putative nucleotidyltransferase with HDIG domain
MKTITDVIEMCDPSTKDHQNRVAALAAQIGQQLMLPSDIIANIRIIGLIHDIGKVILPAEFLARTCDLSPTDREIVRKHPQAGFDMLEGTDLSDTIKQSVLQHHERLDGSGYPRSLKGCHILTEAKIVSVADVVDAMTSHRPYNTELDLEDAINEITSHEGIYYEPMVVNGCLRVFSNNRRFRDDMRTTADRLSNHQPSCC